MSRLLDEDVPFFIKKNIQEERESIITGKASIDDLISITHLKYYYYKKDTFLVIFPFC